MRSAGDYLCIWVDFLYHTGYHDRLVKREGLHRDANEIRVFRGLQPPLDIAGLVDEIDNVNCVLVADSSYYGSYAIIQAFPDAFWVYKYDFHFITFNASFKKL